MDRSRTEIFPKRNEDEPLTNVGKFDLKKRENVTSNHKGNAISLYISILKRTAC